MNNFILETFLSIILLCGIFIFLLNQYAKKEVAAPISLLSLLFIIHYVMHNLFLNISAVGIYNSLNLDFVFNEILYLSISYIVLLISYYFFTRRKINSYYISKTSEWNHGRSIKLIYFLLFVGWISRFYIFQANSYFQITRAVRNESLSDGFYTFIMTFELFPIHALIMVWMLRYFTNNKIWEKISIWLVAVEFIYWFPTGRKEETIFVLLYPLLIRYIILRENPKLKNILAMLAVMAVLFPVTNFYRNAIGSEILFDKSMNITSFLDILSQNSNVAVDMYKESSADDKANTFQRLNLNQEVCACIRLAKNEGFHYGEDYLGLFINLIPRFIWIDKPIVHSGNEFGNKAGIIFSDDITSINITLLGEGFINFGYFGVLPLLFYFIIMNNFYNKIHYSPNKLLFLFLYLMNLKNFMYIGGDFIGLFMTSIKVSIFYWILILFVKEKKANQLN